MTNAEVLTQKFHKQLEDLDLFSNVRDKVNKENDAKFMKKVLESDSAITGDRLKDLHRIYIDCIAAGRFDMLPPVYTKQLETAINMEMAGEKFQKPNATDALKLIGPDRIKRKLTAVLEKEGKISLNDLNPNIA